VNVAELKGGLPGPSREGQRVTPPSRIPWMLRVSGSRRWVTGTRGGNGGSRHACAAWLSVSCQHPGPLTFGMYEGWLHGVKFLLEQPV
jgi:hypothetical protein